MKIKTLVVIISSLFAAPCLAQQIEQVEVASQFYISCTGQNSGPNGNQVIYLENYVDQLLPNPAYITKTFTWNEPAGGVAPATGGNISFGIDPGRQYTSKAGFPATQNSAPVYTKTLGVWEAFPNGSLQSWKDFSPPLSYHAGADAIILAAECTGGTTGPIDFFLSFYLQNVGDLQLCKTVGSAAGACPIVSYNVPIDSVTVNNSSTSIRNLIPATQSGSQIRLHFNAGPLGSSVFDVSNPSHVSICIQSGGGPNCASAPVEVTTNGNSGYYILPTMVIWSDWINFPVTAGQNLLVIESFTNGNSNHWGYRAVSPNGNWTSSIDGWNLATMPGSVTFQSARTHGVDGVQQQ